MEIRKKIFFQGPVFKVTKWNWHKSIDHHWLSRRISDL